MSPNFSEDGTRFYLAKMLLGAIVFLTSFSMVLLIFNITVPDFIAGTVIGGLIVQFGNTMSLYTKSREELQSARIEREIKECKE